MGTQSAPRYATFALAPAMFLVAACAFAAEDYDCPPLHDASAELAQARKITCGSDIDAIERYFDKRQRDYEARTLNDGQLLGSYGAFRLPYPAERLASWRKKYPGSYPAHVASGAYHMHRGLDARGEETAKATSASRFARMDAEMQQATTFLNQSVALTGKPYASYYYLVRMGRYTHRTLERRGALDPRPPVRDYLDKAIRIDPRAYWTRVTYMESLQTRWGGSLRAMEHHYQQAEKAGLSQRELNHLRSLVLFEKSWLMSADTQTEERLKLAIEANTLRENIIVLRDIIWLKGRLRRYADALPEMNRALELEPNDHWVRDRRAVAFFVLERHAEAYQDFLINAQRGDAFAQNKVGYYLYKGIGVAENRREAAQWFAKSAAGGNKAGIENLERAKAEGLI